MRKRLLIATTTAAALAVAGTAFAQGWGYGPGMMGPGMWGQGYGPGAGPGAGMRGMPCPRFETVEVTPETVEQRLQQHLARMGNDRLTVGEVAQAEDGTITAEIVTKAEGALVDKFAFDPDTGAMRRVP